MIEEIREQIKDERQSLFDTLLDTLSEEEYRQYADLKGLDYIDSVESNSSEVGKILQDSLSADVSDSYSDSYSDSENSGIYSYNYLREEEEEETEEPLSEGSYNSSLNQTEVEKKRNRAIKPFQADKERANSLFSKLNKVRRLFK